MYVASLADYNNGRLHGRWIDAAREPEDIQADINAILDSSSEPNAEEWAIHDYEQFGRWKVGEYDSVEQISRIARNIAEHGYAYSAWADVFDGDDASFDIDSFHEAYLGHYDSVTDYVEQMADDLGYEAELAKLPEHLQGYAHIDYTAIARDMELSGDIAAVQDPNGGLWLFRSNQ
ncbi:antirestriction protein [Mycolicibacterium conceptionense]|nr:antirestriction protein [Mycolicibacterium conceptionense]